MQTERPGGPPFHCDPAAMRQLFADTGWIWPEALPLLVEHSPGFAEQPVVLRRQ